MVVMCNDLRELKELLNAATRLIEASSSESTRAATYKANNQETLRDLLRLKALKCASREILLHSETDAETDIDTYLEGAITVPQCNEITLLDQHNCRGKVSSAVTSVPQRPRGTLSREGVDHQVWIEWRTAEDLPNGSVQDKQSILRTATLAQMLFLPKPELLYIEVYRIHRRSIIKTSIRLDLPDAPRFQQRYNTRNPACHALSTNVQMYAFPAYCYRLETRLVFIHFYTLPTGCIKAVTVAMYCSSVMAIR
jgi:hypothetical protein